MTSTGAKDGGSPAAAPRPEGSGRRRAAFALLGVLLGAWLGVSWFLSKLFVDARAGSLLGTESVALGSRADYIAAIVSRDLASLHAIAAMVARDERVVAMLATPAAAASRPGSPEEKRAAWSADPRRRPVNAFLGTANGALASDVLWVVDATGDCVAASNVGEAESFVGTNYADREYFREAMAGRTGYQYAVGRKTNVPGLFFSAPVVDSGRLLGVAVAKVNVPAFSYWVSRADAFVTDEYGVVILAKEPGYVMKVLPGGTLAGLSPEARMARYKRTDFAPLTSAPWGDGRYPGVLRVEGDPRPVLLTRRPIHADRISVHVLSGVPMLARLGDERGYLFVLWGSVGAGAILALGTGVILARSRRRTADAERRARESELEAAQAGARARSAFLSHMSHEIRTPMNAVIAFTELALEENTDGTLTEYLLHIRDAGRQLLGIVNDILDFSKIDLGRLRLEEVPLSVSAVVDRVVSMTSLQAAAKSLAMESRVDEAIPAHLLGDETRLTQILTNLLANAVKFTERGKVGLFATLEALTEKGATVRFVVEDTGIGITAEQIERLFTPFGQADASTTRRFGGTGLGLVITERLVELMGGAIDLASVPEKGTTVTVVLTFPIDPEPSSGSAATASSTAAWKDKFVGRCVLLVEDNAVNAKVARLVLTRLGFDVELARDGREAVEKACSGSVPFDLVLMDIQMPEMNGLEATRAIRARLSARELPIVAMTANALAEDRRACLDAGMEEHVIKPLDVGALAKVLSKVLAGRSPARGPGVPTVES